MQGEKHEHQTKNPPDVKIGFVCACQRTPDGSFIAGLLVTNSNGLPLEFRCTSPVTPTAAQKILYGALLESYIESDLMGLTLFNEATQKPDIVISDCESLLDLRSSLKVPVIHIRRHEGSMEFQSQDGRTDLINSAFEKYKPAIITVNQAIPDELATSHQLLAAARQKMDLVEPFDRIHLAIAEVRKQQPAKK